VRQAVYYLHDTFLIDSPLNTSLNISLMTSSNQGASGIGRGVSTNKRLKMSLNSAAKHGVDALCIVKTSHEFAVALGGPQRMLQGRE
jgi:hypothetical protein